MSWALVFWYASVFIKNGQADGGKAFTAIFSAIVGQILLDNVDIKTLQLRWLSFDLWFETPAIEGLVADVAARRPLETPVTEELDERLRKRLGFGESSQKEKWVERIDRVLARSEYSPNPNLFRNLSSNSSVTGVSNGRRAATSATNPSIAGVSNHRSNESLFNRTQLKGIVHLFRNLPYTFSSTSGTKLSVAGVSNGRHLDESTDLCFIRLGPLQAISPKQKKSTEVFSSKMNEASEKQVLKVKVDYVAKRSTEVFSSKMNGASEKQVLKVKVDYVAKVGLVFIHIFFFFSQSATAQIATKDEDKLIEPFRPLGEDDLEMVANVFSNSSRRKVLVTHENSNITISGEVLRCLKPGAWLNDEVINVYLELLKEREKKEPKKFLKCHFFNTFFYKKLISGRAGYDYKAVRRWTTQRKLGYSLLECDKIFVPVHKQIHWCLAVIDKKEKKFQYLDSLGGIDKQVMRVLARYIVDEVKDKNGQDIDVTSWQQEYVTDLPNQENGFDCGVFMIKYADFYSRGLGLCFKQKDMPYFRLRTAKEILKLRAD
ncbi:hypothetical protein L1987_17259 [Smallanthus sonchifolius]|uniref:Uncharacterized protein n=1 Tax=Smallanthus sonchifolius TaxID=185202 RepID=A0ACB9IXY6_9ASTR|nr:hypothetical protein L1987_17259 [Smallanthus sonchifolius]